MEQISKEWSKKTAVLKALILPYCNCIFRNLFRRTRLDMPFTTEE